jgi:GNAT superfamily N-acetyltransferase
MWQVFREHHYLNTERLGAGVRCCVAKQLDRPVAFMAVVHTHVKRNHYRVSRLVVLPDFQGIGIGKRFLNFIAELYTSQVNAPFFILTSNPQLVHGSMDCWKAVRVGHITAAGRVDSWLDSELWSSSSKNRLAVTLQYIPKNSVH